MEEMSIFTGNANRQLAASICRHLHIPLGDADVFQFSNENIFVKINDNVRGRDVFIIQPFSAPVNRSIMELLIMIDALKRASAARITAVIPFYAYGRTDRKISRAFPLLPASSPTASPWPELSACSPWICTPDKSRAFSIFPSMN